MSSSCPMLPRIVVAAIYKYIGESMMLLWSKSLEMNVVHIRDVCRAVWLLTEKGQSGDVYNLADKGSTTQGSLCEVIHTGHVQLVNVLYTISETISYISYILFQT